MKLLFLLYVSHPGVYYISWGLPGWHWLSGRSLLYTCCGQCRAVFSTGVTAVVLGMFSDHSGNAHVCVCSYKTQKTPRVTIGKNAPSQEPQCVVYSTLDSPFLQEAVAVVSAALARAHCSEDCALLNLLISHRMIDGSNLLRVSLGKCSC